MPHCSCARARSQPVCPRTGRWYTAGDMIRQGARLFGLGRYFWDALREINPNDVRAELDRPVTVAFFGRTGTGRHTLAQALLGTVEADRPGRGLSFNDVDAGAAVAVGLP